MLRIKNISKAYRKSQATVRALDGVSLEIGSGEFVAVRGPSGCGKTTLLLAVGGLLKPDGGEIHLDETDIYQLSGEKRACFRGSNIGFVFQQFHLIPYLTVLENVMTPALAVGNSKCRAQAMELIDRFGMTERAGHVPGELSTGECQRTALARALLNGPRLLLADEPTGNLDPDNGTIVLEHISRFAKEGGAVLMVTHDDVSAGYANRVIKMQDGKIEQD